MNIVTPFSVGVGIVECVELLQLSRKIFSDNNFLLFNGLRYQVRTNFKQQKLYKHDIDENYVFKEDVEILKYQILSYCVEYLKIIGWYLDSSEYIISNLWLNEYLNYGFQDKHNHKGSIVSGTFYVDVPTNSQPIVFVNPHKDMIPLHTQNFYNFFNSSEWKFDPKEGDLFIFPSDLTHYVPTRELKSSRRSISFDVNYK